MSFNCPHPRTRVNAMSAFDKPGPAGYGGVATAYNGGFAPAGAPGFVPAGAPPSYGMQPSQHQQGGQNMGYNNMPPGMQGGWNLQALNAMSANATASPTTLAQELVSAKAQIKAMMENAAKSGN